MSQGRRSLPGNSSPKGGSWISIRKEYLSPSSPGLPETLHQSLRDDVHVEIAQAFMNYYSLKVAYVLCRQQFRLSPNTNGVMNMEHGLIAWLVIGAIAGWLAGVVVKGGGFGLVVDIIVGIVGAFIGGWLAGVLGISLGGGLIGSIVTALIGAVILLFIIRLIKRG